MTVRTFWQVHAAKKNIMISQRDGILLLRRAWNSSIPHEIPALRTREITVSQLANGRHRTQFFHAGEKMGVSMWNSLPVLVISNRSRIRPQMHKMNKEATIHASIKTQSVWLGSSWLGVLHSTTLPLTRGDGVRAELLVLKLLLLRL
jgi:hypothetical protein